MRSTSCTQNTPQWPCVFRLRGNFDSGRAILFQFSNLLRLNDCKGLSAALGNERRGESLKKAVQRWRFQKHDQANENRREPRRNLNEALEWRSAVTGSMTVAITEPITVSFQNVPTSPYFFTKDHKGKTCRYSFFLAQIKGHYLNI